MSGAASNSVFISYRSSDGTDVPFNLYNYFKSKGLDAFFDRQERVNDETILRKVVIEVGKRSNFVILFSEASIKKLIEFCPFCASDKDYVYEELMSAIRNHNNVIPVFFEDIEENTAKKYTDKLFVDCLGLEDSYSYIVRKQGERDEALFERIMRRTKGRTPTAHVDLSDIYWVGSRESDIPDIDSGFGFKGAVLFFGKKSKENCIIMCEEGEEQRVDHNDATDIEQDRFIEHAMDGIIRKDPKAKFMFYNPYTVYRLALDEKYGLEHFVCLNDKYMLERVNNKRSFRELVGDIVPLLPVTERTRSDCDYDDLVEAKNRGEFTDSNDYGESLPEIKYDDDLQFIVQAPVSSGGAGTFILNRKNAQFLLAALDKRARYLVSVYHTNNISVNMHVIIYTNKIIYTPASIQIVREVSTENKLLYKGADFIAYQQIQPELQEQFEKQVSKVAERLKELGYRGVCGIDAIIHDGRVNILEVNGRFQASTELINCAALRRGYKSIQELNYDAFYESDHDDTIPAPYDYNFIVPFSNYSFSYEGQSRHDTWIFNRISSTKYIEAVQADGYIPDSEKRYNAQAFLYRVVFGKNIVSINEDGAVIMHENICGLDKWLVKKIMSKEKLAVKISMMIQGINIEKSIQNTLREATNNAVDLQIGEGENRMIINAPTNIKFVELSPFMLVKSDTDNNYKILYYGESLIDRVGVFPADKNQTLQLKDGRHSYSEIAYLSTDRLRVHLTNECCFKVEGMQNGMGGNGCKFCNIEIEKNQYPIEPQDIKEVVDTYIKDKKEIEHQMPGKERPVTLEHFLIGGQSLKNGDQKLLKAVEVLSRYNMAIYVMTLPLSREMVQELVSYGVLEYAYNIEIFNDACRKKYMPGKGKVPVEQYMSALIETRKILNGTRYPSARKAVRSMVIVGLEPYEDMISGIRYLVENNIEPMLSVFRPLPGTPLEDFNAPPVSMVYHLFGTVSSMMSEIAEKNHIRAMKLGPWCTCCQNNTVSLPWDMQTSKTVQVKWCIDQAKERFEG